MGIVRSLNGEESSNSSVCVSPGVWWLFDSLFDIFGTSDLCVRIVASFGLSFMFNGSKTRLISLSKTGLCFSETGLALYKKGSSLFKTGFKYLSGFTSLSLHIGLVHLGSLQEHIDTMLGRFMDI
jgi:hypothetical protein